MKIVTIGSCMSNNTANNLVLKYGLTHSLSVIHNRSDSLIDYFVENNLPQIPLPYLLDLLKPRDEVRQHATQVLCNQYSRDLGFNGIPKGSTEDRSFMAEITGSKFDLILIDNLMDVSALLIYLKDMPEYLNSGVCLDLGWYVNRDELLEKFRFGNFLTPAESLANYIKLISFLKIHQPTAKIFFLPYHYSSSYDSPERQFRIKGFYDAFKNWASANDVYVVPPLIVDNSLMHAADDWTHFKSHIYEALAGLIYLNMYCDLPRVDQRLSIDEAINSSREISIDLGNPYEGLPETSFWRPSIGTRPAGDISLIVSTKFHIDKNDLIATAGSCFAQYISKILIRESYQFLVTEKSPKGESDAVSGYGVFPARFGNVYTARQLRQLLDRSLGIFRPILDSWRREDGKYVDPFRPNIQDSGFESPEEISQDISKHLIAVRNMFQECNVFIFTLGLTEGWISKQTGAIVPLAPGVCGGTEHILDYKFHNLTYQECFDDLIYFVDTVKAINPNVKVILTVSPVPLVATYEQEHVLTATTYSKSVLRAAAGQVSKIRNFVEYFPSYELITSNFNKSKFYKDNLREVTPEGVEYVMTHFINHYLKKSASDSFQTNTVDGEQKKMIGHEELERYEKEIVDIFCDEELLEKINKPS